MNSKPIVACYMRYSSHAQDDSNSIEAQKKAIDKFVLENNYDLKFIYCDKAKSGTNSKRKDFQRMIKDARNGLFNICIVHKTDRFARSRFDSVYYKNELKENGVDLISITENFGTAPEGQVMEGITEVMAEYYSINLAREVKKGLDIVASKAEHTGGIPPLGFDVIDKKLVINESEAEIVRLIFDRYSNGYTYNDIAKELNAKGYQTKADNDFAISSFYGILTQRKYIGEYVYNKRSAKKKNGTCNSHKFKPEEEIIRIPNAIPRIVSDATFNLVQKRLAKNKLKTVVNRSRSSYLLSGTIKCGNCGFNYQGNTRKSGRNSDAYYSSYRCGKTQNHKISCGNSEIEKNRLETFILEQLEEHLLRDESIKIIVNKLNEYNVQIAKEENKDLIVYNSQLKSLNKQLNNIKSAIAKGVNIDILIDKIQSLNISKIDLERRINEIQKASFPPIVEEDIQKAVSKFKDFMKENNYIECKNFINKYIDKIVVYEDKVEVTFMVASAFFNALYPDDDSGAILIKLEILREELKMLPKQRRKTPQNGGFEKSYLKEYKIINT